MSGLMAVRRAAGAFRPRPGEVSPEATELPPHWFTFIGVETVRQSDLGPDGHAKKGIVLPPIPMPRRMGAGRRVKVMGLLRAGEPAVKKAEVANIVPKSGRSGDIFVLTMRNTYEQGGKVIAVDEADAIYRPAVPAGQKTTATVPTKARGDHAWSERTELTDTLNFRFSSFDLERPSHPLNGVAPRSEEGYLCPRLQRRPLHAPDGRCRAQARQGHTDRLHHAARPSAVVGNFLEVRGEAQKDGKLRIWAADKNGVLCGEMDLEFA